MECESGVSLMTRLSERPRLSDLFGDGAGGPRYILTPVLSDGRIGESGVMAAFLRDVICRMSLPHNYKGVTIGGCGAGILFFNCDHHIKEETIAEELQRLVRNVSEEHYHSLPKEQRSVDRLTTKDQWEIVKRSLERILMLHMYKPSSLEASLVGLTKILEVNQNISLVLINSINSFYHQESGKTGIYHNAYLRRLLTQIVDSIQNVCENLRVIYTQHNLFNKEDNFYRFINPYDKLSIIKDIIYLGRPTPNGEYQLRYSDTRLIKQM